MPTTLPSTVKIEFLSTLHALREALTWRNTSPDQFPMSLEEALFWRTAGVKANGFIARDITGVRGYLGLGLRNPDNLGEMSIYSYCDPELDVVSFGRLIQFGVQTSFRLGATKIDFKLKLSEGERMDHLLKSGFRMQARVIQLALPLISTESLSMVENVEGITILPLTAYCDKVGPDWKDKFVEAELSILEEMMGGHADGQATRDLILSGLNCPDFDPKLIVVATEGDELVGFSRAHRNTINDGKLYQGLTGVLKPWRGRRIASALKAKLIEEIQGADFIELWAENAVGSPLYMVNRALGFQDRDESWHLVKKVA